MNGTLEEWRHRARIAETVQQRRQQERDAAYVVLRTLFNAIEHYSTMRAKYGTDNIHTGIAWDRLRNARWHADTILNGDAL